MGEAKELGHGTAVLEKALDVLDAVAKTPQGVSQADLSTILSLPRTTLYRLLAKLVERGMLRHDPKRRLFSLGFKCFELARQAYVKPDLMLAAAPELRMLRDLTGETTYLAVLDDHEALAIERYDGVHAQRSQSAIGQRKPLYCTAQGKAMLAAMPGSQRDMLIKAMDIKRYTPTTIPDRRRLAAELKDISARGFSIDEAEMVPHVRCVGAAILDSKGEMRGAISLAGPAFRMSRERIAALGREVSEAALRIGSQLAPQDGPAQQQDVQSVDGPWDFRGEFPVWQAAHRTLYWADSLAPSIRAFDGMHARDVLHLDAPVKAMVLWQGQLLLAFDDGYRRLTPESGACEARFAWPKYAPLALCVRGTESDGPRESLWACMAMSSHPDHTEFRVSELKLADVQGAKATSAPAMPSSKTGHDVGWTLHEPMHALAWDQKGEVLYGLNRHLGTIMVMRPGQLLPRRFATVPRSSGQISGLTVDQDGGLWVSLEEGWGIMRFFPDGRQDRVIGLPVPCPTNVAMGGDDLRTLFITTARQSVSLEALGHAPLSGRLLHLQTGPS
jgi:IclR family transcriptional regulator, acetate operon repressor